MRSLRTNWSLARVEYLKKSCKHFAKLGHLFRDWKCKHKWKIIAIFLGLPNKRFGVERDAGAAECHPADSATSSSWGQAVVSKNRIV